MGLSTATLFVEDDVIVAELAKALGNAPVAGRARRVRLSGVARGVFGRLAALRRSSSTVRFAYSVKANPDPFLLKEALRNDFFAEVISPAEFDHAIACGFSPNSIVYNGPYPALYAGGSPGFVFADSLEAYASATAHSSAHLIGLRLRPPGLRSHFGIPYDRLDEAAARLRAGARREFGVAFHVRPQDYAGGSFRSVAATVIRAASELERAAGRALTVFDVGGGKRPDEMDAALVDGEFEWLEREVHAALPRVRVIIAEPGQALATPCAAFLATILESRGRGSVCEIVVDAGYPDVPQIATYEHRFFAMNATNVRRLGTGQGRVIGRTCLEYDVLASNLDLASCVTGATIAIADCGAYDASMSFEFARGAQ